MSDDFDHYYDATVRLTKENEKLAGLLRKWMTAHLDGDYPYIATEEALDAYEAGRAE